MKKMSKPTEEECISRLLAAADALTKAGANKFDIVTAFFQVGMSLASSDKAYGQLDLDHVTELSPVGKAVASSEKKRTPPRKSRKEA